MLRSESSILRSAGELLAEPPTVIKLMGEDFPSEEIRAYWSMVPDTIILTVQWRDPFGMFEIKRLYPPAPDDGDLPQPVVIEWVFLRDAWKLDVWMATFARLING